MNKLRSDHFVPAEPFGSQFKTDSGNLGHLANYVRSEHSKLPFVIYTGTDREHKALEMNEKNITKTQFWIGVMISSLTVVIAACATTWAISSNINDKVNQSRIEIAGILQVNKSELSNRMDRVEDKVDSGFKDTNNGINELKILLSEKNRDNRVK